MSKLKLDKGTLLTGATALIGIVSFGLNVMTKKNDVENTVNKAAEKAAEILMNNASKENN